MSIAFSDLNAGQRLAGVIADGDVVVVAVEIHGLGPDVEISVEIRSKNQEGYDDATRRIVSENAKNLGAHAPEFE